jgi:hypothetical protein
MWIKYAVALFALAWSAMSFAACEQTLSSGDNLQTAIANAAAGSEICLNNGSYSAANFYSTKSPAVTVRAINAGQASIAYSDINAGNGLIIDGVSLGGALLSGNAKNITIKNSTFTAGLCINMRNVAGSSGYPLNITIDNNIFDGLGQSCFEGRISISDDDGHQNSMGVVIKNNQIKNGCLSDGIFVGGGASGVTIGPNNEFSGINQSGSVHCDNIQYYGSGWNNTIEGNFFNGGSTLILIDGNDNGIIRNNVFKSVGGVTLDVQNACPSSTYPILIEHNTIHGALLRVNYYCNATIRNNAFLNGSYDTSGAVNCTNCTASYNIANNATYGSNSIQDTVVFSGGSSPSTLAGYELSGGSPGESAGSDGNNMGTLYYGVSAATYTVTPSAGSNGSISPSSPQTVDYGNTTQFTVTPDSGYTATVGGTCGGSLSGTTYTTNAITGDCTVSATFASSPTSYTVTPSAGSNGSISPSSPQSISSGSTTQFTVTPSGGYSGFVAGTCGGSPDLGSSEFTYTTSAISGDCAVAATFDVGSCAVMQSALTATNSTITTQTESFEYLFSVKPTGTHDLVVGQTNGTWLDYDSFATGVLFGPSGTVTARNGGTYTAENTVNYSAGNTYTVRMSVNIATHTYSVWVAINGGSELQIADNYAFRTTQSSVTQLNNVAYVGAAASDVTAVVCLIGFTADTTAPSVSMTAPADASTVNGSVTISASASDNVAVVGVQFKRDGSTNIGAEDTVAPYSISWDSTTVGNGAHTLSATARDSAGNSATASAVNITVDNTAPAISSPLPSGEQSFGTSSVTLQITTDENATCKYDTTDTAYSSMTSTFATTGGTTHQQPNVEVSNGQSYTYYARCVDSVGNASGSSAMISFSIATGGDLTPPVLSNFGPSASLPRVTTSTSLAVDTNENSTCKYSLSPNTVFGSMTAFSTTGGTSHSSTISVKTGHVYWYYIRCQDGSGNISDESVHRFAVMPTPRRATIH